MDVIWVPDSGSSTSTDASVGVVGMQTFGNLALCVVGLLILVSGAVGRYLLADLHVNKLVLDWTLELWPIIPSIGYLLATTGALRYAFASKASTKRRIAWFAVVQIVAAGLLYTGL